VISTTSQPKPAARQDRAWSQLISDVEFDLTSIDAEIDALELDEEPIQAAMHVASPEDDQATALRRLVEQSGRTATRPRFSEQSGARAEPMPRFKKDRAATLQAARKARVVAIASGKGGVGKTNIAVNTAIALAKRGLRVTLLDADLGTANADVLCGIMPAARLDHVLSPGGLAHQDGATRSISDIVVDAPGGFKLVPGSAGIGRMADLTAGERRWLVSALVELAADADIVLIDAAAGVGQGVTSLLHAADLAIVVTTPEPTAIADAYALVKCLVMEAEHPPTSEEDRIALVVNQSREPMEAFATHARIARVCERFLGLNLPMLGFVAQDVRVGEAVRAQKPVVLMDPGAPASRSMADLAVAIINTLGIERPDAPQKPRPRPVFRADRGVGGLVRRLLGF
jgi:flagellar biosynthesis protein FlhG